MRRIERILVEALDQESTPQQPPGPPPPGRFARPGTIFALTAAQTPTGVSRWPSPPPTSNRAVEEWLGRFDDPILGNSALDRLANASYQIVIEGESYRQRLAPHRALLEGREGGD